MNNERLYNGLPYIGNKDLYKAVQFAIKMIRSGTPAKIANYRASDYYGIETSEVAHYVGIYANSKGKSKTKKYELKEFWCVEHQFNDDNWGTVRCLICKTEKLHVKPSTKEYDDYSFITLHVWFDSREKALEYIKEQEYWGERKIIEIEGEGWYVGNGKQIE